MTENVPRKAEVIKKRYILIVWGVPRAGAPERARKKGVKTDRYCNV